MILSFHNLSNLVFMHWIASATAMIVKRAGIPSPKFLAQCNSGVLNVVKEICSGIGWLRNSHCLFWTQWASKDSLFCRSLGHSRTPEPVLPDGRRLWASHFPMSKVFQDNPHKLFQEMRVGCVLQLHQHHYTTSTPKAHTPQQTERNKGLCTKSGATSTKRITPEIWQDLLAPCLRSTMTSQ